MKGVIILVCFFFLISCQVSSKKDITIYPSINKKDSLLILNIRNNTDSNLMIEFPILNNFYYKDEFDNSNSEAIYMQKSFLALKNGEDLNKNIKCKKIQDIMGISDDETPKFINKRSDKKYYLKITRYREGGTLFFTDDSFNFVFNLLSDETKNKASNIKNQNCDGYKYFIGNFEFYPKKIVLP